MCKHMYMHIVIYILNLRRCCKIASFFRKKKKIHYYIYKNFLTRLYCGKSMCVKNWQVNRIEYKIALINNRKVEKRKMCCQQQVWGFSKRHYCVKPSPEDPLHISKKAKNK